MYICIYIELLKDPQYNSSLTHIHALLSRNKQRVVYMADFPLRCVIFAAQVCMYMYISIKVCMHKRIFYIACMHAYVVTQLDTSKCYMFYMDLCLYVHAHIFIYRSHILVLHRFASACGFATAP